MHFNKNIMYPQWRFHLHCIFLQNCVLIWFLKTKKKNKQKMRWKPFVRFIVWESYSCVWRFLCCNCCSFGKSLNWYKSKTKGNKTAQKKKKNIFSYCQLRIESKKKSENLKWWFVLLLVLVLCCDFNKIKKTEETNG